VLFGISWGFRAVQFCWSAESKVKCVVLYRMLGAVPAFCTCARRQAASQKGISEVASHHVVKHNISRVSPRGLGLVDALTAVDARLYVSALRRFERDVGAVERATNIKILCPGDIEAVESRYRSFIDFSIDANAPDPDLPPVHHKAAGTDDSAPDPDLPPGNHKAAGPPAGRLEHGAGMRVRGARSHLRPIPK